MKPDDIVDMTVPIYPPSEFKVDNISVWVKNSDQTIIWQFDKVIICKDGFFLYVRKEDKEEEIKMDHRLLQMWRDTMDKLRNRRDVLEMGLYGLR